MESWRSEYPFSSHHLPVADGARMHFVDEGPRGDEAVLMLHGNPTWSFYYRNLVLALRGRMRCVVPDHIGMGLSDKPTNYPYRLGRRIADIERLINHLGLRRIHLVVHDWGGAIGFGVATRQPERIGKLVVLNTAAFPDDQIPWRIAVCRWPLLGSLLVRGCNGFAGPAVRMAVTRPLPDEVAAGLLAPYDSWANRVAVHQFVRDIPLRPSHPSFATLQGIEAGLGKLRTRPALIGWGGKDFCFNDHFYERWRTYLPQARTLHFPDAGHYVLEDEAATLVPAIASFLAE